MNDLREDTLASRGIAGERGAPLIQRALSMQARYSNRLAMAVMVALGAGAIAWYYGHQLARHRQVVDAQRASTSADAGSEMHLPPIGVLPAPTNAGPSKSVPSLSPVGTSAAAAHMSAVGAGLSLGTPPALLQTSPRAAAPTAIRASETEISTRVDHRYEGGTYAVEDPSDSTDDALPSQQPLAKISSRPATDTVSSSNAPVAVADPSVAPAQLTGPFTVPALAQRQRHRSMLLSKGTFIDCTLETAIDSSLPGIVTCVTAVDTYGADGQLVLLKRGTRLFGETQGQVQQGTARIYVLWTEARTPEGIAVPLVSSPGTDELGRAGLPGNTERHFWQRFGAAILLSTVDGAVQAAVQTSSSRNAGAIIYSPGTTQDVTTEVLKNSIAIPPTVTKRNGDRIEILVARDVDFSEVYGALTPRDGG